MTGNTILIRVLICACVIACLTHTAQSQYSAFYSVGPSFISGDIQTENRNFNTVVLGGRKRITETIFIESSFFLANIKGHSNGIFNIDSDNSLFINKAFDGYTGIWHPRYQNQMFIWNNTANLRIPVLGDKLYITSGLGFGINYSILRLNLRDREDNFYDIASSFSSFIPDPDSIYDDSYETGLSNRNNLNFDFVFNIGPEIYLMNNVFIHILYQVNRSNSDLLDPFASPRSGNSDSIRSAQIKLIQEF